MVRKRKTAAARAGKVRSEFSRNLEAARRVAGYKTKEAAAKALKMEEAETYRR